MNNVIDAFYFSAQAHLLEINNEIDKKKPSFNTAKLMQDFAISDGNQLNVNLKVIPVILLPSPMHLPELLPHTALGSC